MSFMIDDILGNTTKRSSLCVAVPKSSLPITQIEVNGKDNTAPPNSSENVKSVNSRTETSISAQKRRLSSPAPSSCSSERSVSPTSDENEQKRKKARTSFTNEQIQYLERIYTTQRYLGSSERSDLAAMLNLSDQQVKTWFQNRRMKEKKQIKGVEERLGGTMTMQRSTLSPTSNLSLHHKMATDFLGYSPVNSPAVSPTGMPTVSLPPTLVTHVPSFATDSSGLYGQTPPTQIPISNAFSTASPQLAMTPIPHYPYPGASVMDYLSSAAAVGSLIPTPYQNLMGQAAL